MLGAGWTGAKKAAEFVITSTQPSSGQAALKPQHWLVSAFDPAMILLNSIVEVAIGPMAYVAAKFGIDRSRVTVVPVRRHPSWRDAGDRLGRTEECSGSRHVTCFAQPD